MRENRPSGSEGGAGSNIPVPTPIDSGAHGFPQRCFLIAKISVPSFRFVRWETKYAAHSA